MSDPAPQEPPAPLEAAPSTETAADALLASEPKPSEDTPAAIDVFSQMDKLDEDQVVAEMTGRRAAIAEALVYTFKQQGKVIAGLSKRGVDEAVRFMARMGQCIRETKLIAKRVESGIEARCLASLYLVTQAGEERLLETRWGVKFQPYYERVFAGGRQQEREDKFAYEKACMKACRNASRRLIPEEMVQGVIEKVLALMPEQARAVGPRAKQEDVALTEAATAGDLNRVDAKTVQRIQIGFKECDIAEGDRRGITKQLFGVESVSDLTPEQGVRCLEHLRVLFRAKQQREGK